MTNGFSAIGEQTFGVMSDEEVLQMGLSSIVHDGQIDRDNPMIQSMLEDAGSYTGQDRNGRSIISFKQYEALSQMPDARFDELTLKMFKPGYRGTWLVQASKYHKWYGQDYRAVGDPAYSSSVKVQKRTMPKSLTATDIVDTAKAAETVALAEDFEDKTRPVVYFCADKYPDCKRFFDTERGLKFHWDSVHEKKLKRKVTPKEE